MEPLTMSGDRANAPWWKGSRGEWYVVAQVLLLAVIAVGPRSWGGWPDVPFPGGAWVSVLGVTLLIGGLCLGALGVVKIGHALTPLPSPAAGAVFQATGVYSFVRHPMYYGVLVSSLGWAFIRRGWLTLGYVLAAWVFLELKIRREEKWLVDRFPGYSEYRRRVRKFIPYLY